MPKYNNDAIIEDYRNGMSLVKPHSSIFSYGRKGYCGMQLADHLYKNSSIHLERKIKKYQKALEIWAYSPPDLRYRRT